MASSHQVKVSTTTTQATVNAGRPPVTVSINLKYKQQNLDDDQTFTFLPLVVDVPLCFLRSPLSCKGLLLSKLSRLSLDYEVCNFIALKVAFLVVEEARRKHWRAGDSSGILMEADVEILREQNDVAESLRLREIVPKDDDETSECAVCLEGLSGAGKLIQMPCSHVSHKLCICTWLEKRDSCPICRFQIN